jgi:hypothetical protein
MQHPASAYALPDLSRHQLTERLSSKAPQAATSMLAQAWLFVASLTAAVAAGTTVLVGGASGTAMVLGEKDAAAAGVCLGSCGMH